MDGTEVLALETDQVKSAGAVAIVAVVVVGLLLARLVTKLVTRVIVVVVALALSVLIYQQRARVEDQARKAVKQCEISFFGIHVRPSNADVKQACKRVGG
jgi:hypothetical protein